jgi:hypothetical protein
MRASFHRSNCKTSTHEERTTKPFPCLSAVLLLPFARFFVSFFLPSFVPSFPPWPVFSLYSLSLLSTLSLSLHLLILSISTLAKWEESMKMLLLLADTLHNLTVPLLVWTRLHVRKGGKHFLSNRCLWYESKHVHLTLIMAVHDANLKIGAFISEGGFRKEE